jgi:hypothetical protein
VPPAAERRAWRGVFRESQRAQPFRERCVLRVGGHVDDRVNILGRADASSRWVRDEQARRASTDKYQLVEHRYKQAHD